MAAGGTISGMWVREADINYTSVPVKEKNSTIDDGDDGDWPSRSANKKAVRRAKMNPIFQPK